MMVNYYFIEKFCGNLDRLLWTLKGPVKKSFLIFLVMVGGLYCSNNNKYIKKFVNFVLILKTNCQKLYLRMCF